MSSASQVDSLSRRQALWLVPGLFVLGGGVVLAGCRGNCAESQPNTDSSKAMRAALKYQEHSEVAGKTCKSCVQFIDGGALSCGGCRFFAGGVNPDGLCVSYTAIVKS